MKASPKSSNRPRRFCPATSGRSRPPSDDVVTNSSNVRALWVREDVLDAIGYESTPIQELKEQTIDQGIRPTFEQLEIDPPIDSPEAFMEMLRAIKAADLKAIDGEVDGYLGLPGAKDYLHWLWTAYSEGLIDPDYLVHQSVQLQEKVTTARVAAVEYVPDANAVVAALEENVPGGSVEGPGPYKYGIFDATGNWMSLMSSIAGSEPRFRGTSTELQVANSDQTDLVQGVADWYWGIFSETYLPQILEAGNEAEFEERFDAMMEVFMAETDYAQAKANMEAYFEEFPPVWND